MVAVIGALIYRMTLLPLPLIAIGLLLLYQAVEFVLHLRDIFTRETARSAEHGRVSSSP